MSPIRKSLKAAKKSHDSHTVEIKELETELETVEAKRAEFEEQIEQESQSQGRDLTLEESQVWMDCTLYEVCLVPF